MVFRSLVQSIVLVAIVAIGDSEQALAQEIQRPDNKLGTAGKPIKVFILAGQSNMQGHASISTFDSMADDPKTAPLLKEMRDKDGKPKVCDKVWITSVGCLGNAYSDLKEQKGKLTAGFGAGGKSKIGPEFTFGLTMEKRLDEPVLIIKTSWGGRSLHTDFRPPSAGAFVMAKETQELWDKHPKGAHGIPKTEDRPKFWEEKKAATGVYYREMVKHVKAVLKDIKRVVPDYDEKAGYELAVFVWFQGFNDYVGFSEYPNRDKAGGFDLYADLLGHFIRDVRKDLNAPKLPFVIGVMGIDGLKGEKGAMKHFREAQRKPAALDEFKGNVFAVETAPFWDDDLDALAQRKERLYGKLEAEFRKAKPTPKEPEKQAARKKALDEEFKLEELKRLNAGVSNGGYHYLGAAKILAPIGKAFAEALVGEHPCRDGTLHLLSFGAGAPIKGTPADDLYGRDAGFIVEAVKRSPSAWERVETKFVSGLECTPDRLLKEFDRLVKDAKPGDLVIIHASTHGTTKRGLLQLDSEKGKIIDADVLSARLAKLPCPAIVTIDACEAGGAVRSALPKKSAWLLGCTEKQSTSGQTDNPKVPHGFLVLAMCEALRGDADSDGDGLVTIGELFKWVPSRAKDLAKGECEQDAVSVLPPDLAKLPLTVALPGKREPLWTATKRKKSR